MRIKTSIIYIAYVCALICHLIFNITGFWIYIISAAISGLFYIIVKKLSKNKLGWGDVLFGIFQGFCLPPVYLPVCYITETLIPLIFIKKIKDKPFGFIPFMATGLIVAFTVMMIIQLL